MAEDLKGMPTFEPVGNMDTMNLHNILYQNIIASPYFKSLYEKKTYNKVVDEIYNQVTSLVPFFKGTYASTAFCLLYKLWTLKLSARQIQILIMHPDSPYIRALGFLYLRYMCKPVYLWDWFCNWLDDEEKVQLDNKPKPRIITIGRLCKDLLTEPKWLGTILPRIPVPIARDISAKLKTIELADSSSKGAPSHNPAKKGDSSRGSRYSKSPGYGKSESEPEEYRSHKRGYGSPEHSRSYKRRSYSPDGIRSPHKRRRDYRSEHVKSEYRHKGDHRTHHDSRRSPRSSR